MRKSLVLLAVIAIMATPAFAAQNRLGQTVEPGPPQNFTNVDGPMFASMPPVNTAS